MRFSVSIRPRSFYQVYSLVVLSSCVIMMAIQCRIMTFYLIYLHFCYSYGGCCWISLSRYGNGNWLVSTTVNLTRRSDNGRINSSPVSRSPAIVRWSEGCPSQSLRIPVEDADGDVVKCRYAKYSESYFYTNSFPYGTLDEVVSHFCVNCLYNLFLPAVWLFCRVSLSPEFADQIEQ